MASVETDRGVKEQLRLYDTKGLHDGQDLPKHYYSVADGFVLVYSVDSLESFKKVDILKKEIDKSRDKKEVWLVHSTFKSPFVTCTVLSSVYSAPKRMTAFYVDKHGTSFKTFYLITNTSYCIFSSDSGGFCLVIHCYTA